jgi:hypothetical protein
MATKATQTHFRGIKPPLRIAILRKASHQLYHSVNRLEDYVSAGGDGGGGLLEQDMPFVRLFPTGLAFGAQPKAESTRDLLLATR